MKTTIIATTLALALSTTFAAAQTSQGQAGAATGPTSNSAINQNNGTTQNEMNRSGKMDRSGMTTGSSAGRMAPGSTATGAGNNGNSMGGTNSSANPNNAAGSGSGSAGMR